MAADQLKWQRQLLLEHTWICRYYRLPLPTPLLVIGEGRSRAGTWRPQPSPGVLQIAAWLIQEHGWEVVLEVLKHEMAHQYVDRLLPGGSEPPHGPAFQEACRRLGVHPLFRRAASTIPGQLAAAGRPTGAWPVLNKIEKLLALAGSVNEHEAALAMAKAGELMRRHNLDRRRGRPDSTGPEAQEGYDCLVISTGRRRSPPHHLHLTALLQDFFYVKTISYSLYSAAHDQRHRVLELLGRRENLAVAEYVFHFLEDRLARLWQQHRKHTGAAGQEKNSYCIGVLNGLREKLQRQESDAPPQRRADDELPADAWTPAVTCSSLVCNSDPELQYFLQERYPHLRTVRGRGRRLYSASYEAGQSEGRQLIIHKGLKQQQGNRGKLLD
ncbi:DUF2786 domain-containing protein [Desulfurivibrio dismutans]|uniref:DUF2786 domain-containing protein n=1 Tax=Desulfurivibrio dismutans TaxID=1398908 RepID=UPI0023DB6D2B|nr:DUF2786 domain-containing protein [Desulfurivibrio alkaliphilus]MDF1613969.1 DUF2786 domain-containing protein [Desulfurivibrio alkaliphilus]